MPVPVVWAIIQTPGADMAIIGSNNSNPIQIGVRRNAVIEKNTGPQVGTGVDAPTTTRTMPKSSFGASIAKAFADLGTRFTKWRAELKQANAEARETARHDGANSRLESQDKAHTKGAAKKYLQATPDDIYKKSSALSQDKDPAQLRCNVKQMFDQIKKEAAKQKVDWKELALEKINTSLDGTSLMGIQEMSIDNIRKAMESYDKDGPKSQGVRDFAEMICDGLTRARDPEGAKALFSKSLNDYLRDPEIGKPTAFRSNSSGTTALGKLMDATSPSKGRETYQLASNSILEKHSGGLQQIVKHFEGVIASDKKELDDYENRRQAAKQKNQPFTEKMPEGSGMRGNWSECSDPVHVKAFKDAAMDIVDGFYGNPKAAASQVPESSRTLLKEAAEVIAKRTDLSKEQKETAIFKMYNNFLVLRDISVGIGEGGQKYDNGHENDIGIGTQVANAVQKCANGVASPGQVTGEMRVAYKEIFEHTQASLKAFFLECGMPTVV
ncbi:hypothetical protein ABB55_21985 [Prosthecomicrobium hirschii]|uniref:Uncharacterized protein n=2 Tax=Prosthecodimorpha hirschii TaxID=665126 RepID=A0A0P6VRZ1_9HYPH|nr:hypothetical protein ABB55_21985 [Prosthecomicrobium hirschii]